MHVNGLAQNLFSKNTNNTHADHILTVFYCAFQRAAFLPQTWDVQYRTFHAYALNEARLYEEKV